MMIPVRWLNDRFVHVLLYLETVCAFQYAQASGIVRPGPQ